MFLGKEEMRAVKRVIKSGVLSGYAANMDKFKGGMEVQLLEREWEQYFGTRNAIACNSATSGLWAACNAIGLKPGDEVICTPLSMTCSATIPLLFGAKTVFADVEKNFFCIDPEEVRKKITFNTKAIIAVDLFGHSYDYKKINAIAKEYSEFFEHKIYVIEDAAQASGGRVDGKYMGTLGDVSVFSLNVHKHLSAGEGSLVCTNDSSLAMKIRGSVNHMESLVLDLERRPEYPSSIYSGFEWMLGMNLRMVELTAAVAREQLKKLNKIMDKMNEMSYPFPIKIQIGVEQHAFYRYAFIPSDKDNMPTISEADKYHIKKHYIMPLNRIPVFRLRGYEPNQCPVADYVNDNIIVAYPKCMNL